MPVSQTSPPNNRLSLAAKVPTSNIALGPRHHNVTVAYTAIFTTRGKTCSAKQHKPPNYLLTPLLHSNNPITNREPKLAGKAFPSWLWEVPRVQLRTKGASFIRSLKWRSFMATDEDEGATCSGLRKMVTSPLRRADRGVKMSREWNVSDASGINVQKTSKQALNHVYFVPCWFRVLFPSLILDKYRRQKQQLFDLSELGTTQYELNYNNHKHRSEHELHPCLPVETHRIPSTPKKQPKYLHVICKLYDHHRRKAPPVLMNTCLSLKQKLQISPSSNEFPQKTIKR